MASRLSRVKTLREDTYDGLKSAVNEWLDVNEKTPTNIEYLVDFISGQRFHLAVIHYLEFHPSYLNPDAWLDSSVLSSITLEDAVHVRQWRDVTDNGRNMNQTILAYQPEYNGDGIDFVEDSWKYMVEEFLNSQKAQSVMVRKTFDHEVQDPGIHRGRCMITNERYYPVPPNDTNTRLAYAADNTRYIGKRLIPYNTRFVATQQKDETTGTLRQWANEVEELPVTGISIWNKDAVYRYFGGRYDSLKYDGAVYEILFFNRHLADAELSDLTKYLMNKWDIIESGSWEP